MLYGSVTWTIGKGYRRIEALKIWCFRRMCKISCMDRITNECKKKIRKSIKKIRKEWIGHVLRHGGLLELIIEGYVERKNTEKGQI